MNKYIRTKEKIYEIDNSREATDICYFTTRGWVYKKDIIKQADTPEELCDEFVIKHINNEKPYVADDYQKHEILEDRQKVFDCGVEEVKGAIWISEGLIYVAKMNENGVLELI